MALEYTTYPIAPRGLATSFTEAELPDDYALSFKNRFINAAGGAEKRQGVVRYGAIVPTAPNITGIHELMKKDGTTISFVSAAGKIYRYDSATTWTVVSSSGTSTAVYRTVQMGSKLIFINGVDRNIYTEDGTTFKELYATIERGLTTATTTTTALSDNHVTSWLTTNVRVNDIVYNYTRSGLGVITALTTATVSHTTITNQAAGDAYVIIDCVELNVIPTGVEDDNVAIAGADSSTHIVVSAVPDWTKTEIRPLDFIRNTTKNVLLVAQSVATAYVSYSGPVPTSAGDSLVFLKSAQPIGVRPHVHFGRMYQTDARDQRRIMISGPNNPEDMTTDAGTFDSTSLNFGSYQPIADRVVSFASYQRFMAICGLRNIFLFEGTTPIVDASSGSADFNIVGLFPQGAIAPDGVISAGNDLVYVSVDGIQSISLQNAAATTLGRANLSEPLRNILRTQIAQTPVDQIFMFHYPRRSWVCVKIGSTMYVYNYTPFFGNVAQTQAASTNMPEQGSWSIFDGVFAQQNVYAVLADGTLLCAGVGGKVYKFDQDTYDDDGTIYSTEYQTGWLSMEPRRRSPRVKQGHYIQPVLDAGAPIVYRIYAEAPFALQSSETINVPTSARSQSIGTATIGTAQIGGTSIIDKKLALRWRGKECRFTFSTEDALGPDVLSRFTVYFTRHGAR